MGEGILGDAAVCDSVFLCPTLVIGTLLSAIDFFFDASFVLDKSKVMPMLRYYNWVLKPSWRPVPWPGFISVALVFAPHLTLCMRNTTIIISMYILYAPVCRFYYRLMKNDVFEDGPWWWIVGLLRIPLFSLGLAALWQEGCGALFYNFLFFS